MSALRPSRFYAAMLPQIHWEGENRVPEQVDKVAVIAQFSTTAKMTRSLAELVRQVTEAGYFVLLVSTCPASEPLEWPAETPLDNVAILRRPNIGYDFGSWAVGIYHAPQVLNANLLLQLNDSLVGPFWSLEDVLADFENTPHDWWGMVRSQQFAPHMQSYFVGFKPEVLQSQPFRDFWSQVKVRANKQDLIQRYEVGFLRQLYNEGFTVGSFLDSRAIVAPGDNPMIHGWERALEAGVPFVKRELLTRPDVIPGADRAPLVLQEKYGVDWTEWV